MALYTNIPAPTSGSDPGTRSPPSTDMVRVSGLNGDTDGDYLITYQLFAVGVVADKGYILQINDAATALIGGGISTASVWTALGTATKTTINCGTMGGNANRTQLNGQIYLRSLSGVQRYVRVDVVQANATTPQQYEMCTGTLSDTSSVITSIRILPNDSSTGQLLSTSFMVVAKRGIIA
jgi:hypothetical protein